MRTSAWFIVGAVAGSIATLAALKIICTAVVMVGKIRDGQRARDNDRWSREW